MTLRLTIAKVGAFSARMVVNTSNRSERAARELKPLRDAFTVLSFVSVGMLFHSVIPVERPVHVLVTILIMMLGKLLMSFIIVLAFRSPLHTAIRISVVLAQVSEFSFILAALRGSLGLLSPESQNLILAGATISITLNPLAFRLADVTQSGQLNRRPRRTARLGMSRSDLIVATAVAV